jgi:site-specific DNA recombinase
MRYVGYVRISSEDQRGNYSLDAQKHAIRLWVAQQKNDLQGALVRFYEDEAFTGTTDDRPAFQEMVHAARRKEFDAIVVHKFDRLARNRRDASVYKSLFRTDLGIKVFSVTELSEDEDSLAGMLTEGVLELVAEWYSRNLSSETKKGKREKASQGKHNNLPPFGYDKTKEGILVINVDEAEGVRLAYTEYATGKYSDREIAALLNQHGYRSKTGLPFNREMVRAMLQNRTYLGLIRYHAYKKQPNGRRDKSVPIQWFKGQHEAIVPQDIFDRCQEVRRLAHGRRTPVRNVLTYPLSGLLYCGHCNSKMRAQKNPLGQRYYRCAGVVDWSNGCPQAMVNADHIEEQVAGFLSCMELPKEWEQSAVNAMGELLGQEHLEERIKEIQAIIERLDFRWDMGYLKQEEYVEKREQLKAELARLQPIPQDELIEAHRTLKEFPTRWKEADAEGRQRLLNLILQRAWVCDDHLCAIMLRPSYYVSVHQAIKDGMIKDVPQDQLPPFLRKENGNLRIMASCRCGSDGIRTRDLSLDRAAC